MEKQQKEVKKRGIQKVLSAVVAVCVLIGLIVVATATEKDELYASYDKNSYSGEYKEVVLPAPKGEEVVFKGIRTYVYNEEGARLEENEELVTVELTEEKDYIIREVTEEESSEVLAYEIVLLVEYLNTLYEGEYRFLVDSVELQEEELGGTEEAIIKTEEYIVEIKNSVLADEEEVEVALEEVEGETEESITEEEETEEAAISGVEPTSSMQTYNLPGDEYEIHIESTTMAENAATFHFSIAQGTGTLRTTIDLQGSGETDRYILIKLPAYGMELSATMPTIETGITAVTRVNSTTLRLDILDTATQVLNIDIPYVRAYMSQAMEMAWRNGTPPPRTGFTVEVYGKKGSEPSAMLNDKTYGNWFVDLSGNLNVGVFNQSVPTSYIGVIAGVIYGNYYGSLVSNSSTSIQWTANMTAIDSNVNIQPQYLKMLKWYVPQEIYNASNVNKTTYPLKADEQGTYIEIIPTTATNASASVLRGNQISLTWSYNLMQLTAAGIREHLTADTTYPVKMEAVYGVYTETGVVDKYVMHDMGSLRTAKDVEVDTWRVGANYTLNPANGNRTYNDRGLTMFRRGYDKDNNYRVVKGRTDTLYLSDYANVAYLVGDTSYNPEDRYAGLTVRYDFPYELQPTIFNAGFSIGSYYLGNIDELTYELQITYADGTTATMASRIANASNVSLTQKAGTYIESVSVVWNEFWQNYGYVTLPYNTYMTQSQNATQPSFTVNIMDKDKEGNNIPSGTMAHVDVTMTKGDGTQIAKATQDQLCFFLYDEAMGCPGLTQVIVSGYANTQWRVRAYDQKQEIGYIARTMLATGYSTMRDTIKDPKLVIGMRAPTSSNYFYPVVVNNAERVGYFMTGKMRVYPMLAGWTVNYATYNTTGVTTQRTMVLPNTIEAEGYELQLMIPVGERLASSTYVNATHYEGVVISKDGNVSGWTTNINLVSHIELQSPREKDDGSSFESAGNEGRNYSMGKVFVALTNTDCNCSAHTAAGLNHNYPSLADALTANRGYGYGVPNYKFGWWSGEMYFDYLIGFQSRFTMSRGTSFAPAAPGYDIYQASSRKVTVGGRKVIAASETGLGGVYRAPFFKTNLHLYDIINWEKTLQPTMYIKLINEDFMITEGLTTINFNLSITAGSGSGSVVDGTGNAGAAMAPANHSVPAMVEVILDENWESWIKVTALDNVELPVGYQWREATIYISTEVEVYAIPGAVVGTARPFFEKWYLEDELGSWEEIYDGSEEKHYGNFTVNNRTVDSLDLTGDGDRTTPKLYEYAGYPINVYTRVFSGVAIYPGVRNGFAFASRHQDFYPDARNELQTMLIITTDNSNLENYETVFELPRKDKSINGFFHNTLDGIQTVTSEVDIFLRGPVAELSNSSGAVMEVMYRIGTQWYTQAQVATNGGWEAVSAYRIKTDSLIANSSVNFNVPLTAKEKTTLDDLDAYMGGNISYEIAGMPTSVSMIMGQYTYKSYTIEGVVWNDVNEDGIRVVADLPLSGYKIDLKRQSNNSVIATDTTGADGRYKMVINEYANIYLEITMQSGKKLTYQRTSLSPSAYTDDSDFNRTTNRHEITSLTGSIMVDAGIITLPVITMPNYVVPLGDTLSITGTRTGGYTPTITYAPVDATIASITDTTGILPTSQPTGTVTGLKLGETMVTMTVTNSLGDTATTSFKVTVVPKEVAINLTKQLEAVASEVGVFVFRIEKLSDSNVVEQTFFQTIRVPAGAANATIRIGKLQPGRYRITEIENNWRYSVVGTVGQTVTVTNPDVPGVVTFLNRLANTSWSSGKADVANTMKRVE